MKWITKPWSKVSLVHWQAPFYLLIVGLSLAADSLDAEDGCFYSAVAEEILEELV